MIKRRKKRRAIVPRTISTQTGHTVFPNSCLTVARYGTDGASFYRDQYGVPVDRSQLTYNDSLLLKGMSFPPCRCRRFAFRPVISSRAGIDAA